MSVESTENQLLLTGCSLDWQSAGVMRSGGQTGAEYREGKKRKNKTQQLSPLEAVRSRPDNACATLSYFVGIATVYSLVNNS